MSRILFALLSTAHFKTRVVNRNSSVVIKPLVVELGPLVFIIVSLVIANHSLETMCCLSISYR